VLTVVIRKGRAAATAGKQLLQVEQRPKDAKKMRAKAQCPLDWDE